MSLVWHNKSARWEKYTIVLEIYGIVGGVNMHELYPVVLGWCLLVCLGAAGGWDLRTGRVKNWWLAFWYGLGLLGWACGGWVGAAGYIGR